MSLAAMFKGKGLSGFGYATTAEQVTQGLDLSGKTMLVTGSNSGIGEATAVACELSEAASVHACVEQVKATGRTLDAIICNAGIMALPKLEQKHGYELLFLTNHHRVELAYANPGRSVF